MKCVVCGNIGKIEVEIKNGVIVMLCKRCNRDLIEGELTKGDLHIAHYANLNKKKL